MRLLISLVIVVVVCILGSLAASADVVDWGQLHFDPLENTIVGETLIGQIVMGLTYDKNSRYSQHLALKDYWVCIVEILDYLEQSLQVYEGLDLYEDPFQYRHLRYHSGYLWDFWHDVAKIGLASKKFGHDEILTIEFRNLLDQMEKSFMPLLEFQGP